MLYTRRQDRHVTTHHWLFGPIFLKGGRGIFDMCSDLSTCCTHEGETGMQLHTTGCYDFFFFSKGGHEINAFSDLSACYAHESETDTVTDESTTLAYTLAVMAIFSKGGHEINAFSDLSACCAYDRKARQTLMSLH